jgi:hypothetical protein
MPTFLDGPIFYYPHLREITGSISAALVLSCIYQGYSFSTRRVTRTDESLANESGLSVKQIKEIKNTLRELSFLKVIEEEYVTHYDIDEKALQKQLEASRNG